MQSRSKTSTKAKAQAEEELAPIRWTNNVGCILTGYGCHKALRKAKEDKKRDSWDKTIYRRQMRLGKAVRRSKYRPGFLPCGHWACPDHCKGFSRTCAEEHAATPCTIPRAGTYDIDYLYKRWLMEHPGEVCVSCCWFPCSCCFLLL